MFRLQIKTACFQWIKKPSACLHQNSYNDQDVLWIHKVHHQRALFYMQFSFANYFFSVVKTCVFQVTDTTRSAFIMCLYEKCVCRRVAQCWVRWNTTLLFKTKQNSQSNKVKRKYLYKFHLKKRGRQYAMYKLIFVLKMSWMLRINNVLAEYEKRRIDKRNKITYVPYLV